MQTFDVNSAEQYVKFMLEFLLQQADKSSRKFIQAESEMLENKKQSDKWHNKLKLKR